MTVTINHSDTTWAPDFLGPDYQSLDLDLGTDDEGPVSATLVRHLTAPEAPEEPANALAHWATHDPFRRLFKKLQDVRTAADDVENSTETPHAVLYIHGWADYFFQTELAETVAAQNVAFYALDLRKYGRSLRPYQSQGFTTDLNIYDEDFDAALAAITADLAERTGSSETPRIHLMAHSLGGLISTLWAERHPGRLASLILNGPWLELQGSRFVRQIATHVVDPIANRDPKRVFHFPEMTAYWQSVSADAHGTWELNPQWRPPASFPLRSGWIKAVLNGHAVVNGGLNIDAPILMLLSEKTIIAVDWSPEMMGVDAVIDVNVMAKLGLKIGHRVMVNRYTGALHDVMLSAEPVRKSIYSDLADWLRAYGPNSNH
ncbi:alpha/beta hydrolase [Arthrobacter sp. 35W]|uniref:alpha/beta hydrolase n=1 Tax=Arthrobacter sp. 35W TaxID=1132441 RepID=UPI000425A4F4|nr:alpha/beta hydrolase [Arthrobacter sp. 35W]